MIYFQICLMGLIGLCSRQLIKRKRNVPFADVLIPISDEMASLGAVNVTKCSEVSAAVKNEDYETAAKLHKQIREIENEVKKS